jgi:protein-tyrosine phosphatase
LVVALKQAEHLPLLQERFPAWAEKVEFWHVDDAPEVLGLIEQEVMGLVARILGGGQRPDTCTR